MMIGMCFGWKRAGNLAADYVFDKELLVGIARLPKRQRELAMKEFGKREWRRCSEDLLYWVDESKHPAMPYVYTHDPHVYFLCAICNYGNSYQAKQRKSHLKLVHEIEPKNEVELGGYYSELPTIRPFPLHDYMLPIIDAWLNSQYLLIQKSRDMIATWTTVLCYTWDSLFHEGRQNIFQSEDSSKTFDLVKRAWLIYKHQPTFLKKVHPARAGAGTAKAGVMRIESLNSEIMGFPQGADQIRQYHPSGIFLDERAYLVDAGPTFAAVKPAIENGGRFTAVSSANPSWFWKACDDSLDTL